MKKELCKCGLAVFETLSSLDDLLSDISEIAEAIREGGKIEEFSDYDDYAKLSSTLSALDFDLYQLRYYCQVDTNKLKKSLYEIEDKLYEAMKQRDLDKIYDTAISTLDLKKNLRRTLVDCKNEGLGSKI